MVEHSAGLGIKGAEFESLSCPLYVATPVTSVAVDLSAYKIRRGQGYKPGWSVFSKNLC